VLIGAARAVQPWKTLFGPSLFLACAGAPVIGSLAERLRPRLI
jgi:hypothetical protein